MEPLTAVLLIAAGISLAVGVLEGGHTIEAVGILVAVLLALAAVGLVALLVALAAGGR